MVSPADLLQQEVDCLRRAYSPFAEFVALIPAEDPARPVAAAAAAVVAAAAPLDAEKPIPCSTQQLKRQQWPQEQQQQQQQQLKQQDPQLDQLHQQQQPQRQLEQQQQPQQQQQQQQQQQFLCALSHPSGTLLLTIGLQIDGLQLLQLDCLPGQTPQVAVKSLQQKQQQQQQQQQQRKQQEKPLSQAQQQQLAAWGVRTPQHFAAVFESFESLLQAVCPQLFQRMQQELLVRQLQQQQQQPRE